MSSPGDETQNDHSIIFYSKFYCFVYKDQSKSLWKHFLWNISSYLKDLPKLSHLEISAHLKKKNVCLNLMLAYDFVVFKV